MGHVEAHLLHAQDDRRGGRCAGGHHLDLVMDALLERGRGIRHHAEHDGGAAQVVDLLVLDETQDRRGPHMAQADTHPGDRGHRPGEAPAVAVEHRQRPQIDGVGGHAPGQGVADGV